MPAWFAIAKLLHILSAMLLVGGMFGRDLAFAWARRGTEAPVVIALLALSERFERLMVRPGSELVFGLGLATAWLERLPLLSVLSGARPAWALVSLVVYLLTVPLVVAIVMPGTRRRRQALAAALALGSVPPSSARRWTTGRSSSRAGLSWLSSSS